MSELPDRPFYYLPQEGDEIVFDITPELALEYLREHDAGLGHEMNVEAATHTLEHMNTEIRATVTSVDDPWLVRVDGGESVVALTNLEYTTVTLSHPLLYNGTSGAISTRHITRAMKVYMTNGDETVVASPE